MGKKTKSSLRKVFLLITTTAAALGAALGLPAKKAVAMPPQMGPGPMAMRPRAGLEVIQPRFVSPSATTLLKIAGQAMSNDALAERIFRDPEGVGAQYHLSSSELLVLRHMDRTQFQVARGDAARLVAARVTSGRPMPPGATNAP